MKRKGRAQEGRERERGENQLYDTHLQNLLWWSGFCVRIGRESGDRLFMKRKGRAHEGLSKKMGGRGREGRTNYMTHILKFSCGGEVFAKEFKEKVVIVFFEKERKSTGGTEEEERRERERGDNQL